jgi:putative ABC transport system permease protein
LKVLLDSLPIAWHALRTNVLRSLLTVLGIIIGVAAVIGVVSVVQGLQHLFTQEMQGVGATYILLIPNRTADEDHNRKIRLTYDDGEAIVEQASEVVAFTPQWQRGARLEAGKRTWDSTLFGVSPAYQEINNHYVGRGRFITERDMRARKKVAVVGTEVVQELRLGNEPVGSRITIDGVPFTVVGVMEEKGQMLGTNQDDLVIAPYFTMERLFGEQAVVMMTLSAADPSRVHRAKDQIDEVMRRRRPVAEGQQPVWRVMLQEEILEAISSFLGAFTAVMGGIVGFSLLVGGIGIMNIMLVSVTERTREIGVRKAMGATRRAIASQFLVEAMTLSLAGGVIGVVVGWMLGLGGSAAIRRFVIPDYPAAHVPVWAVVVSFAFCAGIGVLFGIYPAMKAARLDPIEALRYE